MDCENCRHLTVVGLMISVTDLSLRYFLHAGGALSNQQTVD